MITASEARSTRYTGMVSGVNYYKGRVWAGASNQVGIGARKIRFVRKPRIKGDTRGPNHSPSVDIYVAAQDGPFTLRSQDGEFVLVP